MATPANGTAKIIRVFAVDEDVPFLREIESRLNNFPGIRCAGTARSGAEALQRILEIKPDVVLIEARMSGLSGPDTVRKLKSACPTLPIIMLAQTPEAHWVLASIRAGAAGFVARAALLAGIEGILHEACRGEVPLCHLAKKMLVSHHQRKHENGTGDPLLSNREAQVMELLLGGKGKKEIAVELRIGLETAHTHLQRLYAKLGAHSRREAIQKYHTRY